LPVAPICVGCLRATDRAAGGADVYVFQRLRILPVARGYFHDHVILVAGHIDGRNLTLAKRIVKRVVDLTDRDPQPGGGVAVDHQIGLEPLVLLVAVDIGQIGLAL